MSIFSNSFVINAPFITFYSHVYLMSMHNKFYLKILNIFSYIKQNNNKKINCLTVNVNYIVSVKLDLSMLYFFIIR